MKIQGSLEVQKTGLEIQSTSSIFSQGTNLDLISLTGELLYVSEYIWGKVEALKKRVKL